MLGDDLGPRLYVEPAGQGDSDKPRDYPYSTVERADLVEALWRTTACAAPSSSRSTTRRWRCSNCFAASWSAARERAPPPRRRRAGDHGRFHGERRPVRRYAYAPVAGHAAAPHPLGALGMRRRNADRTCRHGDDVGAQCAAATALSGGTRRCGRRSPERWSGIPPQRRRVRRRAPPPRAALDLADRRDLNGTVALYVGGSDATPTGPGRPATRERVPRPKSSPSPAIT